MCGPRRLCYGFTVYSTLTSRGRTDTIFLMLLERVKETLDRYTILKEGDRVLVAVSGGVDSVVLLDILHRLSGERGIELIVAHLDHGMRGEDSREDARFVAESAERKGLHVICERIDLRVCSARERRGLEETGRLLRRRFLLRTADKVGATGIALGHTQNDRAETFLFNLIRGTGPTGLVGMRPVTPQPALGCREGVPVVRPLLEVSREEIVAYACLRDLPWREDRTNQDIAFSRNRIRHQLFPFLEEMNPRVLQALTRTADLIGEERRVLDDLLAPLWRKIVIDEEEGRIVLCRGRLTDFSAGLQALLLRRGIAHVRGDIATGNLQGIEKGHIDALRRLVISPRAHGELDLPGLAARVQMDELILGGSRPAVAHLPETTLELGRTEVPAFGISLDLSIADWDGDVSSLMKESIDLEAADAERVAFPLSLRGRRNGDRFAPLGLGGTKKLQDFLVDGGVPYYERDRVPLLCDRERIIWVVGMRLSEAVRITPTTKRALIMRREVTS